MKIGKGKDEVEERGKLRCDKKPEEKKMNGRKSGGGWKVNGVKGLGWGRKEGRMELLAGYGRRNGMKEGSGEDVRRKWWME